MLKQTMIVTLLCMSMITHVSSADYGVGQVWGYKTRPDEKKSTVLINKVEKDKKLGNIYHISVRGVKVKNPGVAGGISTELPHFPVSEETLKKSLTKKIGAETPNKSYVEGYKTWKAAFDAGKAGIFTISISEIVDLVEKSINKK